MVKRVALAQMNCGIDPAVNAGTLRAHIEAATDGGADILFTPEMTGMLDSDRKRAASKISYEKDDPVLMAAKEAAAANNIWVALGSLALRHEDRLDDKWVNRSFLINADGDIVARYDKIHLFDVDLGDEQWRESVAYIGGDKAVVAPIVDSRIGLSICYDLRFSELYLALSQAGASIISVPAAFTVPTGRAHWEPLLRARAIETQTYIIAAAQTGAHEDGRRTYGHSMVIDPWGEVLLNMREETGTGFCDIDLDQIVEVRSKIPSLANRRTFQTPELLQ